MSFFPVFNKRFFPITESINKITVNYSESFEVLLSVFNCSLLMQFAHQGLSVQQSLAIYFWILALTYQRLIILMKDK